jgi:tetratricopeptide (TPR) repeat protein
MLIPSATIAAETSRFQPGSPFRTVLEFDFSIDRKPADTAKERDRADRLFAAQERCRQSFASNDISASGDCRAYVAVAEEFGKQSYERMNANRAAGRAYFNQGQFENALQHFEANLEVSRKMYLQPSAETGYSYHEVAATLQRLGRSKEALEHYKKAEKTVADSRESAATFELRMHYRERLRLIRAEYLSLLQQSGQSTKDLEKRIEKDPER